MPPETPSQRALREAREERQSFVDRVAYWAPEHRQTIDGLVPDNFIDPEVRAQPEPALVLNRATALLACICLLRLNMPHWNAYIIVGFLRHSFPDILLRVRDVHPLFMASCVNRPRWVHDMRHVQNPHENAIARDMFEVLQTGILAQLPQLPQENYRDPREAIRYLQDLVGVRDSDRHG